MRSGVLDSTRTYKIFWASRAAISAGLLIYFILPASADTRKSAGGRNDQQIIRDVRDKLSQKSEFKEVIATVEDGIVTLDGSVKRYIDKLNAEKRARQVMNVAGVRNWISVADAGITDVALTETLSKKLRYDRIGRGVIFNNFALKVNDGAVTILGNVRDYPDRDSALAILHSTPGVRDVIDEIEVTPVSPMDDDLRIRIASAIYGHPRMTKYAMNPMAPIRIIVERGNVTLHGAVDSMADKQIALMQARSVTGAFAVEDKLLVSGSAER
jgi:hyperosmotically inducible protein